MSPSRPCRSLVVVYTRTQRTSRVAEAIADHLHCPIENVRDTVTRTGALGWLRSMADTTLRRTTRLRPVQHRPRDFDLVIIGTPVWNSSVATPIRTYLRDHATELPDVAFFCTLGGRGGASAFAQMAELCGKPPLGTLEVTARNACPGAELPTNRFVAQVNADWAKRRAEPPIAI